MSRSYEAGSEIPSRVTVFISAHLTDPPLSLSAISASILVRVNLGAGKYTSQGSPSRTSPTTTIPFPSTDSSSPIHTHPNGSPRPETHSLTNTKLLLLPSESIWRPHKRLSLTGPQIAHSFNISSYHYYSEDRSDAKPR
ncbi:hypothetical protein OC845_006952, partial [Tilletia horrida]